jgi:hypothetical protein
VSGGECTLDNVVELEITEPSRLFGFAGWFDTQLSPSVWMPTGPGFDTHWGQVYFPIKPVAVELGDRVKLRLAWLSDAAYRAHAVWSGEIVRNGEIVGTFEHDTRRGLGLKPGSD